MKYEKPEVQLLAAAVSCVQHPMEKGAGGPQDSVNPNFWVSAAAYEVDE